MPIRIVIDHTSGTQTVSDVIPSVTRVGSVGLGSRANA